MTKRNLFFMFMVFFNIPIYPLYWICSVQNDVRRSSIVDKAPLSGGVTLLLIFVTLGIYYFVWQWKTCKHLKSLGAADCSVITLILSLLILGAVINPFIIQGRINWIVKRNKMPENLNAKL